MLIALVLISFQVNYYVDVFHLNFDFFNLILSSVACCIALSLILRLCICNAFLLVFNNHLRSNLNKFRSVKGSIIFIFFITFILQIGMLVVQNNFITGTSDIKTTYFLLYCFASSVYAFLFSIEFGSISFINNEYIICYYGNCKKILNYKLKNNSVIFTLENLKSDKIIKVNLNSQSKQIVTSIVDEFKINGVTQIYDD